MAILPGQGSTPGWEITECIATVAICRGRTLGGAKGRCPSVRAYIRVCLPIGFGLAIRVAMQVIAGQVWRRMVLLPEFLRARQVHGTLYFVAVCPGPPTRCGVGGDARASLSTNMLTTHSPSDGLPGSKFCYLSP
jgi:hypothetical protein